MRPPTLRRHLPLFAPALLPVLLLALSLATPLSAQPVPFVLLHTSDTHGHMTPQPDPTSTELEKPLIGGFAAAATFLHQAKLEAWRQGALPLVFDAGDFFQGTPIVDHTKGACMIGLMNHLRVTAAGIGNHDFDYGLPVLKGAIRAARFPVVNCNVFETATGELLPRVRPYVLIPWKGRTLGVTAVLTAQTPSIALPENMVGLEFRDPGTILDRVIPAMRRKGADFIVLLSHLGIEEDRVLVSRRSDIDLILGSHSHTPMTAPEFGGLRPTPIFHAAYDNRFFTKTTVVVEPGRGRAIDFHSVPLFLSDFPEDPETRDLVASYMAPIDRIMKEVLGRSEVDLVRGVIGGDSSEGSFMGDAMRRYSGADFAFMNFGGVRFPLFRGDITAEHIFTLQPFPNTVEVLTLTGAQVRQLIEQSLSVEWTPINAADQEFARANFQLEAEGLKREFNTAFGYLVPANLHVTFDPTRPPMDRIVKLTDGAGAELEPARDYQVAFNSYLAGGGDGFTWLKQIAKRRETGVLVRDMIMRMIREDKGIARLPEQRMFNLKQTVRPMARTADGAAPGMGSAQTAPGTTPPAAAPSAAPACHQGAAAAW
ncbi:MAG: bifunctional metallophosphatase/5'-nucleotidase [Candidatus Riflebacteria bacterium]|nr:bifunctional metallophosphatase/5'-nucleotidase [Candidatus Riflebacteria bacterium]